MLGKVHRRWPATVQQSSSPSVLRSHVTCDDPLIECKHVDLACLFLTIMVCDHASPLYLNAGDVLLDSLILDLQSINESSWIQWSKSPKSNK